MKTTLQTHPRCPPHGIHSTISSHDAQTHGDHPTVMPTLRCNSTASHHGAQSMMPTLQFHPMEPTNHITSTPRCCPTDSPHDTHPMISHHDAYSMLPTPCYPPCTLTPLCPPSDTHLTMPTPRSYSRMHNSQNPSHDLTPRHPPPAAHPGMLSSRCPPPNLTPCCPPPEVPPLLTMTTLARCAEQSAYTPPEPPTRGARMSVMETVRDPATRSPLIRDGGTAGRRGWGQACAHLQGHQPGRGS